MTEPRALKTLGRDHPTYVMLLLRDAEFKENVAEAKKARADVFYEKIVDSVDDVLEKEEVAAAKLRLDTLKYLAAMDNPDKYSEKVKHSMDVNINIFQEIKDLPAAEARRLIANADPFTIDAEIVEDTVDYGGSDEVTEEDMEDLL